MNSVVMRDTDNRELTNIKHDSPVSVRIISIPTVSVAPLRLCLLVVLGVGDGRLDEVLDVSLDVLPELEHVGALGAPRPSKPILRQLLGKSILCGLPHVASL